jgi:dihydroorotate dehydrogenase (NAD+) catalytic subunit
LTLINTIRGMAIDLESRRPHLATVVGGLSGPAIKPVALRMVWEAAQNVGIPVIGVGGILSGEDAAEFLIAGASAVQVGTAHFRNPAACIEVTEDMERYLERHGIQDVKDLIGSIRLEPSPVA